MTTLAEQVKTFDAALADWEVADRLNAPDDAQPKLRQYTKASEARGVLMRTGDWPKLKMAAQRIAPFDALPAELWGGCVLFYDAITLNEGIDTQEAAVHDKATALLGAFVAVGIMTAETQTRMLALTEAPQSWARANGYPPITARDVGLARGARSGDE